MPVGEVPGNDRIFGDAGDDIIFGDHGIVSQSAGTLRILTTGNVTRIETTRPTAGGVDTIDGGIGLDVILGGQAGDTVTDLSGASLVFGDHGLVDYVIDDLDARDIDRIGSTDLDEGGADTITTGAGNDIILGGAAADMISSGGGLGIVFGDNGRIISSIGFDPGAAFSVDPFSVDTVETLKATRDGDDRIDGGSANDLLLGGGAGDTISAGAGNDLVFGDYGRVRSVDFTRMPPLAADPFTFEAIDTQNADGGGDDTIDGEDGDDILLGQQGSDTITGGAGDDDIIGGHNVAGGQDAGDRLDGEAGRDVIVGDNGSVRRRGDAVSPRFRVLSGSVIYDTNGVAQATSASQVNPAGTPERNITLHDHSTTTPAGSYGNDYAAGGSGDDVILGGLGDDTLQGDGSITLVVGAAIPSIEDFAGPGSDGDDYIEGNGGADVIFGNLGQDDLVGGSSSFYGLTTPAQRPDGRDTIFGGAGTRTARNDPGDTSAAGHARDADSILGDNGNIVRLVGINGGPAGGFLSFNYDSYGPQKIVVRAQTPLDYTPGGAPADLGDADTILGEAGDDTVRGLTGNDVLFGDGQDDDLYGGTGHDRIYGGSGEDGILGDDGWLRTSRNGLTEPLNGVTTPNAQAQIALPGPDTGAWVFITGRLNKEAVLAAWTQGGNDVVYGGLGDDFLHGGAGDDGISGAEALPEFYSRSPVADTNPLHYDPATRKLAAYDAGNPLRKVNNFFLNFAAMDTAGVKINDGKDRLFGDLGHDWLVGGTQNDRLFGGAGDDLMNADDNLDTAGGLNNRPDDPAYADFDFAYGGDGLDVLVANTGGDRLYDWTGEFNTFVVPFTQFGEPTVNRLIAPAIPSFLLGLGLESGADRGRIEPDGELGLFTQQDPQWGTNTGSPRDPQGPAANGRVDTTGGPEDDRGTGLALGGKLLAAPAPVATHSAEGLYGRPDRPDRRGSDPSLVDRPRPARRPRGPRPSQRRSGRPAGSDPGPGRRRSNLHRPDGGRPRLVHRRDAERRLRVPHPPRAGLLGLRIRPGGWPD